jgi:hypothetical protein
LRMPGPPTQSIPRVHYSLRCFNGVAEVLTEERSSVDEALHLSWVSIARSPEDGAVRLEPCILAEHVCETSRAFHAHQGLSHESRICAN